ncbi:hypothetical protein [Nocardia sp. NPDC003963]
MIVRVQSTELSGVQRFVRRLLTEWGPGTGRVGGVALLGSPLPRSRRRSAPATDLLVWTPHGCTLVVLADFGSVQHGVLTTGPTGRWLVGDGAADLRTGKSTPNPILRGRRIRNDLSALFRRHGLSEYIDVLVVLIPKTGSRISWTPPPPDDGIETILVRIGAAADLAGYFERSAVGGVRWRGADIERAFEALGVSRDLPGADELANEGFVPEPGRVAGFGTAGHELSGAPVVSADPGIAVAPPEVSERHAGSRYREQRSAAGARAVASDAATRTPAAAAVIASGPAGTGTPGSATVTEMDTPAAPRGDIAGSGPERAGDPTVAESREVHRPPEPDSRAAHAGQQTRLESSTAAEYAGGPEHAGQAAVGEERWHPAREPGYPDDPEPRRGSARYLAFSALRGRFGGGIDRRGATPEPEHGGGGRRSAANGLGVPAVGEAPPPASGGSQVDPDIHREDPVAATPAAVNRLDPDPHDTPDSVRVPRGSAGVPAGMRRVLAGAREVPARARRVVAAPRPAARPPREPLPYGRPARRGKDLRYPLALGTAGIVLAAVAATVFAASGFARFEVTEYGALCGGGEGNPAAAPYSAAGPSPVYLGGDLPEYTAFEPSAVWRPIDPGAVQLVACIAQERRGELVHTCQYPPGPGQPVGRTLNLFTAVYRLTLFEARTGNQLAAIPITGDQFGADPAIVEPDSCRAATGAPEDGLPGRRHSRPSQQQIEQALTPFVAPAAQRIRAAR